MKPVDIMVGVAILLFAFSVTKGCGPAAKAQEDLPYGMTCQPSPADGTPIRRCENAEVICYIGAHNTVVPISCFRKEGV
jgi:hypothetical protein